MPVVQGKKERNHMDLLTATHLGAVKSAGGNPSSCTLRLQVEVLLHSSSESALRSNNLSAGFFRKLLEIPGCWEHSQCVNRRILKVCHWPR